MKREKLAKILNVLTSFSFVLTLKPANFLAVFSRKRTLNHTFLLYLQAKIELNLD